LEIVRDAWTSMSPAIRSFRRLAFCSRSRTAICACAGAPSEGRFIRMTRPESSSLKRMFTDYMWEWLTPSFIFVLYYAPVSITIILFARFHIGSEFVTGFCFGGAIAFGCVIISDLHRGYREFKRQSDEIDRLIIKICSSPPVSLSSIAS
jgi:hypothetical protein